MDLFEEILGRRGHHGHKRHDQHGARRHGEHHSTDAFHGRDEHHDEHEHERGDHREREAHHRHAAVFEAEPSERHHGEDGRHWTVDLHDDRKWTPLAQLLRSKTFIVLLVAVAVALLGAIIALMFLLLPLAGELLGFVGDHGIKGVVDKVWSGSN